MSEEKKGKQLSKEEIREKLQQYFLVVITYADWIPEPYKKMASSVKSLEELNEIYLCACEGVPVENIQEKGKDSSENQVAEIRTIRHSYLISEMASDYEMKIKSLKNQLSSVKRKKEELERKFSEVDKAEDKEKKTIAEKEEVPKIIVVREQAETKRFPWIKQKDSVEKYIERILADERYSGEQISYILDSLEEGISLDIVKAFASPKLPVQVMQRLRMMEEKKRKGEKEDGTG